MDETRQSTGERRSSCNTVSAMLRDCRLPVAGFRLALRPAPLGMPHAKLQLLDAAVDGGAADAELACGLGDVALALGQ